VAEADESDGSFLFLPATYAVVTNIDNDHLDHFGSLQAIEDAFVNLVGKLPFYGMAAVCADDPGVRRCMPRLTKPFVTYGTTDQCDYSILDLKLAGFGSSFEVIRRDAATRTHTVLGRVEVQVPGRHNALNALGALAIALELGVPFEKASEGIKAYRGVKRRFEIRWENRDRQQAILDDYGHHPTEILATLAAARGYWPGRIVTVFQPHRYTRTRHCRDAFIAAFGETDVLYVTDIYSAGEEPIEGISADALVESIRAAAPKAQQVEYSGDLEQTRARVLRDIKPGDLVICLGAGSITRLPDQLIQGL
jgi:UDP-N-acetylmuramate--alanine ligase